ncbi:MAG: DNA repair protein RecO [Bacteroidetes bacterium]|nr:DNA repair protein RecO [Bacteroidota bacterium]
MNEIVKTETVVLSKLNYGDTSKIVSLYTKDYGKLSAIIKGGRNSKSKIGLILDVINHIQIVMYKKDTREIQIISDASLISPFSNIKEDLEKIKYAQAIIELLQKLTVEHEVNHRLFKGVTRILYLLNTSNELPIILFGRFFIFFLAELGYAIQLHKCSVCGRTNLENIELSYNLELGILCNDCKHNHLESYVISPELFNYLNCLTSNKKIELTNVAAAEKSILFMEKYLMFHIPDFKGIQSLKMMK